jgi:hypothetical protein
VLNLILIHFLLHFGGGVLDLDGHVYGHRFGGVGDSGGSIDVNLREGAKEQAADVGKNGGAASRDAVLGQEGIEVVEGVVDALSGLEALVIMAEVEEVVGGLLFLLFGAMLGTENRTWIGDGETASAAA